MRITFVLPGYCRKPIGGVRVVYTYANHLVAQGHEVTVVHVAMYRRPSVRAGMPQAQAREILGGVRDVGRSRPAEVHWQSIDERVDLRYAPVLTPGNVPDGDAIVATAWQTADGVARLGPEKGLGAYLIQHHETWSGRAQRVDDTWRLPLRKIFIAPWLAERARSMGLTDVHRVPGAIDTERFQLITPIAERSQRVSMLASGHAWKGLADGLAALTIARASFPSLQAVLFGTNPRPRDLPSWIDYEQDPDQDRLVRDIYNGSSIYLCPSHAEGWHLPPAEAMACGCAVVSTDIDGVSDYAVGDVTALLAPVRDPAALGAALVRALGDDTRRTRLAQAGYESIRQFRWDSSARALADALAARALERA